MLEDHYHPLTYQLSIRSENPLDGSSDNLDDPTNTPNRPSGNNAPSPFCLKVQNKVQRCHDLNNFQNEKAPSINLLF